MITNSPPPPPARQPLAALRRHPWRTLLGLGLLFAVLWVGGDFAYVSIGATDDHATPADVIVVLGCNPYAPEGGPSICMRARGGHAAALYHQGLAPWVIATGGPTDGGPTEASVLDRVLEAEGVPASAILREEHALNTIQNIAYSQAIMQAHGWHTALLVTEPFHINRATLIAREAGLTVYPSPALDSLNWTDPKRRFNNLTRDTLSLILYQLKFVSNNVN